MVTYKSYMCISHFDRPSRSDLSDLPDLGCLQIATMPPWRPKHRFRQPGARGAQSARQISIIGWSWMVPSHCLGTAYGICMFVDVGLTWSWIAITTWSLNHSTFEKYEKREQVPCYAMVIHGHPWSFNTVPAKTTWLSLGARGKGDPKHPQKAALFNSVDPESRCRWISDFNQFVTPKWKRHLGTNRTNPILVF